MDINAPQISDPVVASEIQRIERHFTHTHKANDRNITIALQRVAELSSRFDAKYVEHSESIIRLQLLLEHNQERMETYNNGQDEKLREISKQISSAVRWALTILGGLILSFIVALTKTSFGV
jgi:hypothetical protein